MSSISNNINVTPISSEGDYFKDLGDNTIISYGKEWEKRNKCMYDLFDKYLQLSSSERTDDLQFELEASIDLFEKQANLIINRIKEIKSSSQETFDNAVVAYNECIEDFNSELTLVSKDTLEEIESQQHNGEENKDAELESTETVVSNLLYRIENLIKVQWDK